MANPLFFDPMQYQNQGDAVLDIFEPQQDGAPVDMSALSGKVQELLGAREPDNGGLAKDILSSRFNTEPSYNDYASGIVQSALGKPQMGTDIASSRIGDRLKTIAMIERLGGTKPAALQIADELARARSSGNGQRLKDITLSAKLADKGIVYDENGNAVPITGYADAIGGIAGTKSAYEQQGRKGVDLRMNPQIEYQTNYAGERGTANAKSDTAVDNTLPVIDQLRQFNKATFTMPYADTAAVRGYTRVLGGKEQKAMQTNMDLLKQARTDLAAPLAKELGVNPTDRDFQATLDRIFDSNADQASRDAQINALEQRILARKASRDGSVPANNASPKIIKYEDLAD